MADLKPEIRFTGFTEDWEQRKLEQVTDLLTGYPFKSKQFVSEGIPLIRGINVKRNYLDMSKDNCEYWPYSNGLEEYLLEDQDILIQMDGALIGKSYARIEKNQLPALLVQRVTRVRSKGKDVNSDFIYQSIQKGFLRHINGIKTETAVPHLSLNDIRNFEIMIPKYEEQKKIGGVLNYLDNFFTFYQCKYNKLVNIKKSMLEKMFPKDGADVPEIRFAGFTGAWEQRKFSSTFDFLQNNTLSRAELSYKQGLVKDVHYGDVLIKFGECLDAEKENLPYVSDVSSVIKYKNSFLRNGDIVIADTAEDETVGKCSEIVNLGSETLISGLHTIPCRPTQPFSFGYLGYYMNSSSYHDQLLPLMQGIKVTSISKTALQDTVIKYPVSGTEQKCIGGLFIELDNLITLHQQELEKLKTIKKSLLDKMFV